MWVCLELFDRNFAAAHRFDFASRLTHGEEASVRVSDVPCAVAVPSMQTPAGGPRACGERSTGLCVGCNVATGPYPTRHHRDDRKTNERTPSTLPAFALTRTVSCTEQCPDRKGTAWEWTRSGTSARGQGPGGRTALGQAGGGGWRRWPGTARTQRCTCSLGCCSQTHRSWGAEGRPGTRGPRSPCRVRAEREGLHSAGPLPTQDTHRLASP